MSFFTVVRGICNPGRVLNEVIEDQITAQRVNRIWNAVERRQDAQATRQIPQYQPQPTGLCPKCQTYWYSIEKFCTGCGHKRTDHGQGD
jgi:membrane protease subunit (stomatin/prohibitin family)